MSEPRFFIMSCEGKHPVRPIQSSPRLPGWMRGQPVALPAELPLRYVLNPRYPGNPKLLYDELSVPIMHRSLRELLGRLGVPGIDFAPACLEDPLDGAVSQDYVAFNITLARPCVDAKASAAIGGDPSQGDADYDGLVLDEAKLEGTLLCRASENLSAVVVHHSLKAAIEAAGLPGFVFYGPGEWAG